MRRPRCAAARFVETFKVYAALVLEKSGHEDHRIGDWIHRETGVDVWGEPLENLRETLRVVAEATYTLPRGQLVRPDWSREFAEFVLIFHAERGKADRNRIEREAEQARRQAAMAR